MKLLCLNQSTRNASQVLGHLPVEEALRIGLDGRIDATFVRMEPWGPGARWLAKPIPGLCERDLDFHEFRWHLSEALRGYAAVTRLRRRLEFDAVHVTSHTLAFGLAGLMKEFPVCLSVDVAVREWAKMGIWTEPRPYSNLVLVGSLAMERRALERAALVQAWTEWTRKQVVRAAPSARVVVIHPGINTSRFVPATRRPRERARVLFVGGRFVEKGGQDLLDALRPELGRTVDVDLVTRQDIPAQPGVTVHRLQRDDLAMVDLYQQADLFCLPTRGDTLPWVLLEALGCGTPIVSGDVGPVRAEFEGHDCAMIVPPRDVPALREAILTGLVDEAERRAMGRRGRAMVEEKYDARTQGAKVATLIEEAVGQRRDERGALRHAGR
jgi:glycosyltransferase involved in cell wall biosynthesis